MELATPDVTAASSPALEVPRDSEGYAKWRQTGELPDQSQAESTPAKKTPAEGEKPEGKTAPASETGNSQEKAKPRNNAETRLSELLDDLKRAGLSPAELKTFKREAQKAEQSTEAAKPPEHTEKPVELKAPTKPKTDDFKDYAEYEEAKDKYYEDLADFKAAKAIEDFQQKQQQQAAHATMHQKMQDANARYGAEAAPIISATAREISGDQQISQPVKLILDQSPVMVDVLYVLGSKAEELAEFVTTARTDPGAAIRKLVLIEQLVTAELAKGGKSEAKTEAPGRDDSGKFTKTTPEKKESAAPPPPREVSGRGTTPPDEVDGAVKNNDFARYREAQNARDAARLSRR